jgi:hypothetical protein
VPANPGPGWRSVMARIPFRRPAAHSRQHGPREVQVIDNNASRGHLTCCSTMPLPRANANTPCSGGYTFDRSIPLFVALRALLEWYRKAPLGHTTFNIHSLSRMIRGAAPVDCSASNRVRRDPWQHDIHPEQWSAAFGPIRSIADVVRAISTFWIRVDPRTSA